MRCLTSFFDCFNVRNTKEYISTSNKDNIEDLIIGINRDIFWGDQAFMKDLDNCVAEMEELNVYSCVTCEKTYKSKGAP